jgi:dTDP-4-amino-4,6-dideoxygalactose transaminase
MVLTPDGERANRIKRLALHGLSADAWKRFSDQDYEHYEVVEPGFKYNMMDLRAALGIHQLARVEDNLVRREAMWQRYDAAFAGLPAFLPPRLRRGRSTRAICTRCSSTSTVSMPAATRSCGT